MAMIFLDAISRLLKGRRNANRTAKNEDVRQRHDGGGVYRFASAAERTISDCRRVGLLAAALSAQSGGDADCSPRDKVRKLTDTAKPAGLHVPPRPSYCARYPVRHARRHFAAKSTIICRLIINIWRHIPHTWRQTIGLHQRSEVFAPYANNVCTGESKDMHTCCCIGEPSLPVSEVSRSLACFFPIGLS